MASYVGLDLSSSQARILEADGSAKKLKVKKFKVVEVSPPTEAPVPAFLDKEAGEQVERGFKEAKIARDSIAMSWDSALTVFREMDLPFSGRDQVAKVIKYEAESHLLNCDIDEVVVSFYALSETKDKSHLMVMAAQKDQLLNRFEVLQRGGIDPLMVDLDVMASFNALDALGYTRDHKTFLVLDCGRRTTNVLLIEDGRLLSGRAIRLGTDSFALRLAHDLEADPKQVAGDAAKLLKDERADDLVVPAAALAPKAETAKNSGELARDIGVQRVDDFCSRLAREVKRTLVTAKTSAPIEVVYATGPGSLLPGFAEGIATHLGIAAPMKPLALYERVDHALPDDVAELAETEMLTALGLAFKVAGHDATNVDFRQEECRYARKFDQVKEPLIYFCCFLLFLVLLLNLYEMRLVAQRTPFFFKESRSDIARIHAAAVNEYKSALGKNAVFQGDSAAPGVPSLQYMTRKMTESIDGLKAELGRGGAIPELMSAFTMWRDTFDAVSPRMTSIGKLLLDDVEITVRQARNPSVKLNGFVPNASAYEDLKEALRSIKGVQSVEAGEARDFTDRGQGYKFTDLKVIWPEREEMK